MQPPQDRGRGGGVSFRGPRPPAPRPCSGRLGDHKKLMRLLVDEDVELPNEIGDLQALQELSPTRNFSIKFVETLRRLTRLKTFGISVPFRDYLLDCVTGSYKEALKSSLASMGKHGLQTLHICNGDILEEELMDILCCTVPCIQKLVQYGSSITRLPKQLASLVNLTHLSLALERIKQENLCILGALPALLFCELSIEHAPDDRLTISSQQFRCLKEFRFLNDFPLSGGGLEMLFLKKAMPELRRLQISLRAEETESKMGFLFSFEHLASLEHISVTIWCAHATRSRVEAAEAAIKNAVIIHPGHPTLHLDFGGSTLEDGRERERGQVGMRNE